jgi:hypothetical protein
MSTEGERARIERLTDLAQRVWLGAAVEVDGEALLVFGPPERDDKSTYVVEHLRFNPHPRGLDALEAALLVLSGARMMIMVPPTRGYAPFEPSEPDELAPRVTAAHVQNAAKHVDRIRRLRAELDDPVVERETVICSAIRLCDGRIFRGHRHHDCIRTAHALVEHQEPGSWDAKYRRHEQGFITSRNRYVDREEGLRLQKAAGIESACRSGYRHGHLFSEDLY